MGLNGCALSESSDFVQIEDPMLLDLFLEFFIDEADEDYCVGTENYLPEKEDHTLFNREGRGELKYFSNKAT